MGIRMYGLDYPTPSPSVIELKEHGVVYFGLKIKDRFVNTNKQAGLVKLVNDMARWSLERMLEEGAVEAFAWAVENRKGDLVMPPHEPADYVRISFTDARDATLFKLYWIG